MAALSGRQAAPSLNEGSQLIDTPSPQVPAIDILVPREPQITPTMSNGGAEVFTTVLYPSVPTEAPTANAVPTIVTYTGTLNPSEVPGGFQWTATASVPGTSAPMTPQNTPSVVVRPTAILTSPVPTSVSTATRIMTSQSFSMSRSSTITSLSESSKISTTSPSLTSSTSTALSSSISSTSKTASNTLSALPTGTGLPNKNEAQETHRLSSGSIAGVVVGVISGVILLVALALFVWSRKKRAKRPTSPGIYPEEAYLYDPPMTPPRGSFPVDIGSDVGRALSPVRPGAEREGLMKGAEVAVVGISPAAAGKGRPASGARLSRQWNGYSPVEPQGMMQRNFTIRLAEPSSNQPSPAVGHDPFTNGRYELAAGASSSLWPLNPDAESGLGNPPGTALGWPSTRPSTGRPSTSRTQGTEYGTPPGTASGRSSIGPLTRPSTGPSTRPSTGRPSTSYSQGTAGPRISGVGSLNYIRRVSSSNPRSSLSNPTGETIPSPYMKELRKAWGMDQ